jgi:hypothetical protein
MFRRATGFAGLAQNYLAEYSRLYDKLDECVDAGLMPVLWVFQRLSGVGLDNTVGVVGPQS